MLGRRQLCDDIVNSRVDCWTGSYLFRDPFTLYDVYDTILFEEILSKSRLTKCGVYP